MVSQQLLHSPSGDDDEAEDRTATTTTIVSPQQPPKPLGGSSAYSSVVRDEMDLNNNIDNIGVLVNSEDTTATAQDNITNSTKIRRMVDDEEEEVMSAATLSWTSSTVSLSPLNPPFAVAAAGATTAAAVSSSSDGTAIATNVAPSVSSNSDSELIPMIVPQPLPQPEDLINMKVNLNNNDNLPESENENDSNEAQGLLLNSTADDNDDDANRMTHSLVPPSKRIDWSTQDEESLRLAKGPSLAEANSFPAPTKRVDPPPQTTFFIPQDYSTRATTLPTSSLTSTTTSSTTATGTTSTTTTTTTSWQQHVRNGNGAATATAAFDLYSMGDEEEEEEDESRRLLRKQNDEEEEDDYDNHDDGQDDHDHDFLPANSLLHQFHHHGRLPSTIAEEHSERPLYSADEPNNNSMVYPEQQHRNHGLLLQPLVAPHSTDHDLDNADFRLPASPLRYNSSNPHSPMSTPDRYHHHSPNPTPDDPLAFTPWYRATLALQVVSRRLLPRQHVPHAGAATWIGFWALLHVTCANYVLTPMRDAIALQVGVQHIPRLTLASTVLAVFSSVPIGWLFEAPDPGRRKLWKRMGLTRGATQGSSLALFYRFFALTLLAYAVGFQGVEWLRNGTSVLGRSLNSSETVPDWQMWWFNLTKIWMSIGQIMYIAFFLVVHLMKLHCLSLVWGVTTEAMEYEEVARKQQQKSQNTILIESNKMRLQRLSLIGFGGTLGGILGSFLASSMAQVLRLPGLLLLAALLLEVSAELSIELGRIMQKHWEGQQQLFQSTNDLASLDASMKRSSSLGSMKRISSGNSLNRAKSTSDLNGHKPLGKSASSQSLNGSSLSSASVTTSDVVDEDNFSQRLIRGLSTILKSRLLMAIFTYNALYASTTVLLSFQRAALVANRSSTQSVQADTAFLANINMVSSAAIFALQSSGVGAFVADLCGSRGTLALMPLVRLLGVLALAWWHRFSGGRPPNLLVFLVVDECCKIMNLAVAKPVRESLWRGLSNEARYEAKPIVDTLANRWGGGSAAFLVSFVDKTLDLFGVAGSEHDGVRNLLGFPPILFLGIFISAWWAVVSADLGQIRKNIDVELKKRQ